MEQRKRVLRKGERPWGVIDRVDVQADTRWTFESAMAIAFGDKASAEGFVELPGIGMVLYWSTTSGRDPIRVRVPMRVLDPGGASKAVPWWDHRDYHPRFDIEKDRMGSKQVYPYEYTNDRLLHVEQAVQPLPYKMDADAVTALAWKWLEQADYEAYGEHPDTDGSAKKGFRVWMPGLLRYSYAIIAIPPTWIVYGK